MKKRKILNKRSLGNPNKLPKSSLKLKSTVKLEEKSSKKLKYSAPNYFAKRPDPSSRQHSPTPPAPLSQSADFQLCRLCSKVFRKEHFALHQQACQPTTD